MVDNQYTDITYHGNQLQFVDTGNWIILDTPTEWWIIMLWQLEENLQFVDVAVVDITHGFTVAGLRFYHGPKVLPAILS